MKQLWILKTLPPSTKALPTNQQHDFHKGKTTTGKEGLLHLFHLKRNLFPKENKSW